ncbi:MAG: divalent metal cation transporter [Bacteroidota bacterium]
MSHFRRNAKSILLWSIISAAFIGPGTVTTAAKAGASFGVGLLWALLFSIGATVVLQEAAARLSLASGKSLGAILSTRFQGKSGRRIKIAVFAAVAFGCAAYEMGNLLGAVSGLAMVVDLNVRVLSLIVAGLNAVVLWKGKLPWIARTLGIVVALMGLFFIYIAFQGINFATDTALFAPLNESSALLIIALIGTTIVPYNLFLATGIGKGQSVPEMRWGIISAVIIGGVISVAILLVGTQLGGDFSFQNLAQTLASKSGNWAKTFFAFGLCAAGLSSAITAPVATAVTAKALFGETWGEETRRFRAVSLSVLGIGLFFCLLQVKPVPAIILAQAINGVLLPIIAIFLFQVINDHAIIPEAFRNSKWNNTAMLLIVGVTAFLGIYNILKATEKVVNMAFPLAVSFAIGGTASLALIFILWRKNRTI